ncbi:MAG: pyridoxamine 5'-phosphate oxidase, partial [SAR324 cluster bacterium]|nr:pyridoxamine 5'-phosphate oxidase [SAR324 cluster bacterium]
LCFYWGPSQRQVRIRGYVELVDDESANQYFASRPRQSQIGAWASEQSKVLGSRAILDKRVEDFSKRFSGVEVPRPSHWSGFRLTPFEYEFWQLRLNRLHDRFLYTKMEDGSWKVQRLYP